MQIVLMIISIIVGITSLVCWIMIEIQMFKTEDGPLKGIIGIVTCGIYALIWGWMKVNELPNKNIIYIWTGAVVISIIVQAVTKAVVGV